MVLERAEVGEVVPQPFDDRGVSDPASRVLSAAGGLSGASLLIRANRQISSGQTGAEGYDALAHLVLAGGWLNWLRADAR